MSRLLLSFLATLGASTTLAMVLKKIHVATGGWPPEFIAGAIVGAVGVTVARPGMKPR